MPYYAVESRINLYDSNPVGMLNIPENTKDLDQYYRKTKNYRYVNPLVMKPCEMGPLTYFPRMARPIFINDSYVGVPGHGPLYNPAENMSYMMPDNRGAMANSVNQLSIMMKELKNILNYIQPDTGNLDCYGHHSRNVLLLASMEFENECKGVLKANGYGGAHLSTSDYIKVLSPMRLDEYSITLPSYPQIGEIKPFSGWSSPPATKSLGWYHDYNSVKHDREVNFNKATLLNAIKSVSAVAIMLAAEYRIIDIWRDQIGEFFLFKKSPNWRLSQFCFFDKGGAWTPVLYSF